MKNILLAVTGMSPQVITETLFGIAKRDSPWPESIHIITTQKGADKVMEGLFEEGHLAALCRELDKPLLDRDSVEVLVVPGADNQPVNDARTLEDHEALADFIMETVRRLTAEDTRLHASIAGGRKTMTFYLGYAMSLFGRSQDRMSHVLISEGYEGNPNFYYPTHESHSIEAHDGQRLDTREAEVSLADIPFIRQRNELPAMLRSRGQGVSFRKLVDLINLGACPEVIRIELKDADMRLDIFEGERLVVSVSFTNRFDWSWYQIVTEATRMGDPSLRRGDDNAYPLGWRMLERLSRSLALPLNTQGDYREQLKGWLNDHETVLENAGMRTKDFEQSMRLGLDIAQVTHRINRRLQDSLPEGLAGYLRVQQMLKEAGEHSRKRIRGGGYAINLRPEQIRLIA